MNKKPWGLEEKKAAEKRDGGWSKLCLTCESLRPKTEFEVGDELCKHCRGLVNAKQEKTTADKFCHRCVTLKPFTEFYSSGSYCTDCMKELSQEQTLKRYGITMPEYISLFDVQDGRCAICEEEETAVARSGEVKMLSFFTSDHAEGLLCDRCFKKMKPYKHDTGWLLAAAGFLK